MALLEIGAQWVPFNQSLLTFEGLPKSYNYKIDVEIKNPPFQKMFLNSWIEKSNYVPVDKIKCYMQ